MEINSTCRSWLQWGRAGFQPPLCVVPPLWRCILQKHHFHLHGSTSVHILDLEQLWKENWKNKQIRQMKRRDSHGSLCRKDLLTNTVPSILLIGRRGDSITVITAEEYERTFKGGGEIKSSMCVSLTGRPLSEVTDHHTVCILPLHCVRRPGRYSKSNRSKSLLRFTLLFKGLRPLNRVTSNGCWNYILKD